MVVRVVVLAGLLLGACQFDPSAPLPPGGGAGAADAGGLADAQVVVTPDAALCADADGDGFRVPLAPGADCAPLDCDDTDDRARPDQTRAFVTPTPTGSFDFDCDGEETPMVDAERGGDCRQEIFGPCEGTGWIDEVPACGDSGTWHRCEEGFLSCDETERVDAVMPCR